MKNLILFLIALPFVFASCADDKPQELSQEELMDLKLHESQPRPAEVIPLDNPIHQQILLHEKTWDDMYVFFNDNISRFQDEAYYDNLLHFKTSLVEYKGFEDISVDQQKSFLIELLELERTPSLHSIAQFIASSNDLSEEEKSEFATGFLRLNEQHLESASPEFRSKRLEDESYSQALETLNQLVI